MSAGTGADGDDAVDTLLDRFLRMADVDDIVKHDAAVTVHGLDDFGRRAQARDDDRYLVPDTDFHVVPQPVVAVMTDLVDGVWCDRNTRVRFLVRLEFFGDPREPLVEHRFRACVERRKRADDACLALRNDQLRSRDNEHGCPDDRDA